MRPLRLVFVHPVLTDRLRECGGHFRSRDERRCDGRGIGHQGDDVIRTVLGDVALDESAGIQVEEGHPRFSMTMSLMLAPPRRCCIQLLFDPKD